VTAAEDECPRPVERIEHGESLRAGRGDDDRRDQEKRREKNERDETCSPADRKIQMSGNRRDPSPAEPKTCTRAEHERRDLPERSGEKNHERNGGKRDAGPVRSGVRVRDMPQMACATTATATSFRPCRKPSATGPVNAAAPIAKANRISAEGMVKANHAARPPKRPLSRRMPREKPTWLEAGPGRN
jgi:hypothetical protein